MFVLYALLVSLILTCLDLIYIKVFQLEGYKISNYIKKILKAEFSFGNKTPLVYTKRINRLIFFNFLLNLTYFLLFFELISHIWIEVLLTISLFLISPLLIVLTFIFALPFENCIKNNFIKKAKNKLKTMPCKKIAITGSFGKTSTKNILYQIMAEEFDVCSTPKSYNTPMGICKTILENLKETDDFFIVEFGARHIGDIDFLAKFVGVDFGIVTPIGNCHLETFGTIENIENAKYELCENTKDWVVFNGKSKSTKKLFDRYLKKKYLVCEENSFAYAKNIKSTEKGSLFSIVIDGKEFECQTKLLGKANVDNIVVASTMAYLLGESLFNIQKGIKNLKAIPHRLELIKGEFVNVIDDSYNSNYEGFLQALQVLESFEGKKIVVSPGIVELGKEQEKVNFSIAKEVAHRCDIFVIMNQTNKVTLFDGAIKGGLDEKNIYFCANREEQKLLLKKILHKGDVVLFENDFPDNIK